MATPDAKLLWLDFGWWSMSNGTKKLLSWNQGTHELCLWPLAREAPIVLAVIIDEDEVRRRLEGWESHNSEKEGLSWLAQRLEGCR